MGALNTFLRARLLYLLPTRILPFHPHIAGRLSHWPVCFRCIRLPSVEESRRPESDHCKEAAVQKGQGGHGSPAEGLERVLQQ